jgi:hypothetical protein
LNHGSCIAPKLLRPYHIKLYLIERYGMSLANPHPPGQPGDFDFLSGHWHIRQRRLSSSNPDVWDSFEGEASCWSILDGMTSIEELRIPARGFAGMGLRVLDRQTQVWSDTWMNAASGVLTEAVSGYFEDGRGVFIALDAHGVHTRGLWDNISANGCRWQQASSHDGGASWQDNWVMEWTRVG